MFGSSPKSAAAPRDHTACSGCSLCRLVCPAWRRNRDPRYSPEGLAKALQCGATAGDLLPALEACSLCGACDPACPEGIDLSGLVMRLRRKVSPPVALDGLRERLGRIVDAPMPTRSAPLLLPGPDLRADQVLQKKVMALLGLVPAADDGADLALALEAGVEIPEDRLGNFLVYLAGHSIVVEDGLLMRQLRRWLPGSKRMGLGTALSTRAEVRGRLQASDLYVIEARAYHADHARMVHYYDDLQRETGCALNLDLQRIAIPATASGLAQRLGLAADDDATQARWILQGRRPQRIIVESMADRVALERVAGVPVLHVAELADAGN